MKLILFCLGCLVSSSAHAQITCSSNLCGSLDEESRTIHQVYLNDNGMKLPILSSRYSAKKACHELFHSGLRNFETSVQIPSFYDNVSGWFFNLDYTVTASISVSGFPHNADDFQPSADHGEMLTEVYCK